MVVKPSLLGVTCARPSYPVPHANTVLMMARAHHDATLALDKTMTTRYWAPSTTAAHYRNYKHKRAFVIWGGQGHNTFIAWAMWTHMALITARDITPAMCAAEGYPHLSGSPGAFTKKFILKKRKAGNPVNGTKPRPPITHDTTLVAGHFTLVYPAYQGESDAMTDDVTTEALAQQTNRLTVSPPTAIATPQGAQTGLQPQTQAADEGDAMTEEEAKAENERATQLRAVIADEEARAANADAAAAAATAARHAANQDEQGDTEPTLDPNAAGADSEPREAGAEGGSEASDLDDMFNDIEAEGSDKESETPPLASYSGVIDAHDQKDDPDKLRAIQEDVLQNMDRQNRDMLLTSYLGTSRAQGKPTGQIIFNFEVPWALLSTLGNDMTNLDANGAAIMRANIDDANKEGYLNPYTTEDLHLLVVDHHPAARRPPQSKASATSNSRKTRQPTEAPWVRRKMVMEAIAKELAAQKADPSAGLYSLRIQRNQVLLAFAKFKHFCAAAKALHAVHGDKVYEWHTRHQTWHACDEGCAGCNSSSFEKAGEPCLTYERGESADKLRRYIVAFTPTNVGGPLPVVPASALASLNTALPAGAEAHFNFAMSNPIPGCVVVVRTTVPDLLKGQAAKKRFKAAVRGFINNVKQRAVRGGERIHGAAPAMSRHSGGGCDICQVVGHNLRVQGRGPSDRQEAAKNPHAQRALLRHANSPGLRWPLRTTPPIQPHYPRRQRRRRHRRHHGQQQDLAPAACGT